MVSSPSLQARGSSGCLLKKPPHYLHCTRGRCSTSPLRCFERSGSPNRTAAFLNHGHLSFYTIVMKITELLPHHTRSVFRRSSFSSGKASHPSLERKMFCILHVPRAAILECKIKNTNSQCLAFFFFFFFFLPPSNRLRYFKCCLSFRGRAALDVAVHRVNNCHPESLTV